SRSRNTDSRDSASPKRQGRSTTLPATSPLRRRHETTPCHYTSCTGSTALGTTAKNSSITSRDTEDRGPSASATPPSHNSSSTSMANFWIRSTSTSNSL